MAPANQTALRFAQVGNYNFHLPGRKQLLARMIAGFGQLRVELLVPHPLL